VYDYLKPSEEHRGYLGKGDYKSTHFLYKRWKSMMERCYKEKNKDYRSYGKKGVTVCKEWHCFQNYARDVMSIDGYNEELAKNNTIELDKDIKIAGNKIYSLDSCIWIDKTVNNRHHAVNQFSNHIIIDTKLKKKYHVENLKQFCDKNDWINLNGIRAPRKEKSLYKRRWYILYEECYNSNKSVYDNYIEE